MSFYDVNTSADRSQKNNAKILGGIMLVAGVTFVTWFAADMIYVSNNMRIAIYSDVIMLSRVVIGVLSILGGMVVMKNEDWSTIKP